MRLFIIFIFLTFVVLEKNNAAPQSNPTPSSPIGDKSLLNTNGDDYVPTLKQFRYKVQFGGMAGDFGDNTPGNWNYLVTVVKRSEISFERFFLWGFSLTSNQMLELKTQVDLSNLFLLEPGWDFLGLGFSHFISGRDGISNLVNINQAKIVFYCDLGPYFQVQGYYGLKGLAYSLSFQSWF